MMNPPTALLAVALLSLGPACGAAQKQAGSDGSPSTRDDGALARAGIERSAIRCNTDRVWSHGIGAEAAATAGQAIDTLRAAGVTLDPAQLEAARKPLRKAMMWRLIRALIVAGDNNNLGVIPLRGVKRADGQPVILFRSGLTPQPAASGSCFGSLVGAGGVRHVLNLYAGPMVTGDLEDAEQRAVKAAGGRYFLARQAAEPLRSWRDRLRHGTSPADRKAAMTAVARIINENILRPGGALPKGNVHVHCGGGMHRTGMIVGVLDRCINGAKEATLTRDYRRHVAWQSEARPGGFEADNLRFIQSFDCSLLKLPKASGLAQ